MDKPIEEQINQLANQSKVQLIVSQEHTVDDEISLGELFGILLDGKKIIALITLIAFMAGVLFAGVNTFVLEDKVGQVESVISFNFPGIEEGLNPNGDKFDVTEVMNKQNLNKAIADLGLGMSSEILRENLEIQQVVPASVQQQLDIINKMAEKDVTQLQKIEAIEYYPTQYKLTLNITKDMALSGEEAEQLLSGIIRNYIDYFNDTYGDKQLLSTAITQIDPSRYDYLEYVVTADTALKDIETFLKEKEVEAPNYRAKSTGLGFSDLLKQANTLRDIELNNTQAIINSFTLTKNKERLISVYQNNLKNLERDLQEQENLVATIEQAIADYEKDKVVVMGREAGEGAVEVSTSTKMYDQLVEQSLLVQEEANKIRYNLQYYKDLLAKLTAVEEDTKVNKTNYIQLVDEKIASVQEQIVKLIEDTNTTAEEYYTTEMFKDSIKRDMPPIYESFTMNHIKDNTLVVVITILLGGVVSVLYVLTRGMMVESIKKQQGGSHEA